MRCVRILSILAAFVGCLAAAPAFSAARGEAAKPGEFDYYVLALSWSPTFCEAEGDRENAPQCAKGKEYGFVVHGLWPQWDRGWPEYCNVRRRVPKDAVQETLPLIPSKGLIYHQWKKHGTCSGLEPRAYFADVRKAFYAVATPAVFGKLRKDIRINPQIVEDAFMEANEELDDDEIRTVCGGGRLREVRICMTKDFELMRCGRDARRDCSDSVVRMPGTSGE